MSKTKETKDTVCQGCVFISESNRCEAHMLSSAENAGLDVVECWNEEGEFNVIPGRKCTMKRPASWAAKQGVDIRNSDVVQTPPSTKELIAYAQAEMKVDFSAMVVCQKDTTIEDIAQTLQSLVAQEHEPVFVGVVREHACKVDPKDIFLLINAMGFDEWKIENPVDGRNGRKAVEGILKFKLTTYFATFKAGRNVDENFFSDLNYKITREWFTFAIIKNDKDPIDGVVVPSLIYKYFGNNFDKLEEIIEEEAQTCQGILNIQQINKTFQ